MTFRVKCKCGRILNVPSKLAGRKLACPNCKKPFRLPANRFRTTPVDKPAINPEPAELDVASDPSPPSTVPADMPSDSRNPVALLAADEIAAKGIPLATEDPNSTKPPGKAGPVNASPADGPTCPSCNRVLPPNARICVQCGINVASGRSLLTSEDGHLDATYTAAQNTIWIFSWLSWFGIYPVASEAFGTRKPWVIRSIALLTILTSAWFWAYDWTDSPTMQSAKFLMLWSGEEQPDAGMLMSFYSETSFGDSDAFFERLQELTDAQAVAINPTGPGNVTPTAPAIPATQPYFETTGDLVLEAHYALTPKQRCLGEFRVYQLLTNAFLHGDILHLAGNLLFLMVFGARVNALIGNIRAAILYPVLAIAGSLGHMLTSRDMMPHPALGASGAIMGLAGMYLVVFPVHKVHMAVWLRIWFRLGMTIFAVRGLWVVLFYIAFDVFFTVLNIEDNVAHWAHLGGFIVGVSLALILLFTRLINARGADIVSVILGRRAWKLVGKPRM